MHGVAVKLSGQIDGLESEFHDPSHTSAKGHHPSIVVRFPIRRQCRLPRDEPALLKVVIDEVLKQHLVYCWSSTRSGNRPDIVGEPTQRPVTRLSENYDTGPQT